jgi:hypothetical protein
MDRRALGKKGCHRRCGLEEVAAAVAVKSVAGYKGGGVALPKQASVDALKTVVDAESSLPKEEPGGTKPRADASISSLDTSIPLNNGPSRQKTAPREHTTGLLLGSCAKASSTEDRHRRHIVRRWRSSKEFVDGVGTNIENMMRYKSA